jgi:hypothetical protein
MSTGDVCKFSDGTETHNALVLQDPDDGPTVIVYVTPAGTVDRLGGVLLQDDGVYVRRVRHRPADSMPAKLAKAFQNAQAQLIEQNPKRDVTVDEILAAMPSTEEP